MKTKKMRFLALLLSVLLIASMLPPSAFAEETADEPTGELTQETIDRVYEEVLSGEVTSTEDVLRVALAQYEARQTSTYGMRSADNTSENDDELPRITQVIETTQDEDGNTALLVADTALFATDESGSTIVSENLGNQVINSFSGINIVAYHTVYYTYEHQELPPFYPRNHVLVYKQTTKLVNNGATLPTKLIHEYWSPVSGVPQCTYTKTFSSPSFNTTYTSYPSGQNVIWEDLARSNYPGFGSKAIIVYGSVEYEISIDINANTVTNAPITW